MKSKNEIRWDIYDIIKKDVDNKLIKEFMDVRSHMYMGNRMTALKNISEKFDLDLFPYVYILDLMINSSPYNIDPFLKCSFEDAYIQMQDTYTAMQDQEAYKCKRLEKIKQHILKDTENK